MLFEFGIMWEVRRRVSGSVLNFTGLRNSRITGNTDHLVQACDCPEVGELSLYLLTISLGLLNRWDCQGERAVPEGGFAVIDQWNTVSALTVYSREFACACSVSLLTLVCVLAMSKACLALRSVSVWASWSKKCNQNCWIIDVCIKWAHEERLTCNIKGSFIHIKIIFGNQNQVTVKTVKEKLHRTQN